MQNPKYGSIQIHLQELLQNSGLSKSKLIFRAELQRTQLNYWCRNEVKRLDTDVLARLCTVLDCTVGDLLEFIPVDASGGVKTDGIQTEMRRSMGDISK